MSNNVALNNDEAVATKENTNENIFQKVISKFMDEFYPHILKTDNLSSLKLEIENSQKFLSNLEFYRIYECVIENTDDLFKYFSEKMGKIFVMFYYLNIEFYYGIVSKENKVNLVIGFKEYNISEKS